jgi:hypothetical protein
MMHSFKQTFMHAGTVRITHGIAPRSTRTGSVRKPQAARSKIWQGGPRYAQI